MADNRVGEPHLQSFSSLLTQHGQGHSYSNKSINFLFPPYEGTSNKYFREDFLDLRMENMQFPYSPMSHYSLMKETVASLL